MDLLPQCNDEQRGCMSHQMDSISRSQKTSESIEHVPEPLSFGQKCSYVTSLPLVAKSIYPEASAARLVRKAAVFSLNGIRHQQELVQLKRLFNCPELEDVLTLFPAILEKPFSPYVCVDWDLQARLDQLEQHFSYLKASFGHHSPRFYRPEGYRLFEFDIKDGDRCAVEVFPGYQCEGSIGLRLVDGAGTEIYTISMHFCESPEPTIIIGALQGPNHKIDDRQQKIVTLTRSLHGLRPKSLMVEAVYMMASVLGITSIMGITNAGNIYQSPRYSDAKRASIFFDFDSFWEECLAEPESAHFVRLQSQPVRKDLDSLSSKKRALYRKRYAWIDDMREKAEKALGETLVCESATSGSVDISVAA